MATKAQRDAQAALRAAEAAVEAARAAVAVADEAARPKEPVAGSKVLIKARFPRGEKTYEYLALRAVETPASSQSWYVTGQDGKLYWDDVLDLVRHASTVSVHLLSFAASAR